MQEVLARPTLAPPAFAAIVRWSSAETSLTGGRPDVQDAGSAGSAGETLDLRGPRARPRDP